MKKFEFGLQQVMEWRDRRAEQERSTLEQLHSARSGLEAECAEVGQQIAAWHMESAISGGSSDDLRRIAGFLEGLRSRENRVRQSVAQCQTEISRQTVRCVDADRDRQLLARLRDRQFSSWKYELNRETEAAAADSWTATRSRELRHRRSDCGS